MKANKPTKSVSEMSVLKDIRGLLSSTGARQTTDSAPKPDHDLQAIVARLEGELAKYKELAGKLETETADLRNKIKAHEERARKQGDALENMGIEKNELEAKLNSMQPLATRPPDPSPDKPQPSHEATDSLKRDIFDLEARKDEMSSALTQVEDLLQIKIKDLARRIARVYEEAGDYGANRDFRRITSHLEASENFGEFLRALLRE